MTPTKDSIERKVEEFERNQITSVEAGGFCEVVNSSPVIKGQAMSDWLRQALLSAKEEGRDEREDEILKEGYRLIDWHKNPQNHWAGLIHANTTINGIQSMLDIVRESLAGQN